MAGQFIRSIVLMSCSGLLAAVMASAVSADEPYSVWIVPGGAEVYSGPDETYYATQALAAGDECQVFEQLPGGWLAIRPPEGSFSVVSEAAIEPAGDGVARVVRESASSRIGSQLTTKHDAMHVRLERGELLQLTGDSDPTDTWVKIEPPAGEFRYVRTRDASRVEIAPAEQIVALPVQTVELGSGPTAETKSHPAGASQTEEVSPIVAAIDIDKLIPATDQDAEWVERQEETSLESAEMANASPAASEIQTVRYDDPPASPAPATVPGQFVAPNLLDSPATKPLAPVVTNQNATPAPLASTTPLASGISVATPAVVAPTPEPAPGWQASGTALTPIVNTTTQLPEVTAGAASSMAEPPLSPKAVGQAPRGLPKQTAFDAQLDQIEVQVSRRVSGPVNLWRFEDLERSAAQLLGTAATPDQTRTVNELASRLSRLGELGRRHREANLPGEAALAATGSIASVSPQASGAASSRDPALSQYDAVGVLRPVVSSRGNAPPYALVDESGQVVTFVTPAPSLNLQPHLGKRIGVSGARGFLPEYSRRNIQTASVAPLGDTLVR